MRRFFKTLTISASLAVVVLPLAACGGVSEGEKKEVQIPSDAFSIPKRSHKFRLAEFSNAVSLEQTISALEKNGMRVSVKNTYPRLLGKNGNSINAIVGKSDIYRSVKAQWGDKEEFDRSDSSLGTISQPVSREDSGYIGITADYVGSNISSIVYEAGFLPHSRGAKDWAPLAQEMAAYLDFFQESKGLDMSYFPSELTDDFSIYINYNKDGSKSIRSSVKDGDVPYVEPKVLFKAEFIPCRGISNKVCYIRMNYYDDIARIDVTKAVLDFLDKAYRKAFPATECVRRMANDDCFKDVSLDVIHAMNKK